MINVYLHGSLKKYGNVFAFDASDTADALRLLFTQRRDISKEINAGSFTVKIGNIDISESEIKRIHNADEHIHILPVVAGKKGAGKIILGAALIGAAFLTGGTSMAAWGFGSSLMFSGGTALLMYGASSMFFKPQKFEMNNPNQQETGKSAHFGNIGNSIANNTIYPVCYGTYYCGSARVSEGVISMRNNPNQKPNNPIAGQMEELKREYFLGTAARDPNGNLYRTDFSHDSVKAQNYKVL